MSLTAFVRGLGTTLPVKRTTEEIAEYRPERRSYMTPPLSSAPPGADAGREGLPPRRGPPPAWGGTRGGRVRPHGGAVSRLPPPEECQNAAAEIPLVASPQAVGG